MDAMSVLIVRLLGQSITLRLGGNSDVCEEWPVTVTITSPTARAGHCMRWWPLAQLYFDSGRRMRLSRR